MQALGFNSTWIMYCAHKCITENTLGLSLSPGKRISSGKLALWVKLLPIGFDYHHPAFITRNYLRLGLPKGRQYLNLFESILTLKCVSLKTWKSENSEEADQEMGRSAAISRGGIHLWTLCFRQIIRLPGFVSCCVIWIEDGNACSASFLKCTWNKQAVREIQGCMVAIWFSDLQFPLPSSFARITVSARALWISAGFLWTVRIVPLNWKAVSLTSWCSAHPRPEHTIANLNGNKHALKDLKILKYIYSKYVVAFFFLYKDDHSKRSRKKSYALITIYFSVSTMVIKKQLSVKGHSC